MPTSSSIYMSSAKIFHEAIVSRDLETIKRILKEYPNWIFTDVDGETVLHLPFKRKNQSISNQMSIIQILDCFLNEGLSVNKKNAAGQTVLFSAVKNRLRRVIDYLIVQGANLNVQDKKGDSIVHILIEDLCKQNPKNAISNLLEYVKQDDINFMTWLLSKGVNVDCRNNGGHNAFILAVEHNLKHVLPTLLKNMNGFNDLDGSGCTIIESFFKARVQGKFHSNYYSDFTQDIEIVKFFLEKGVSVDHVDNKGNTLFHTYVKSYDENPVMMDYLLQRYTSVNAQDQDGNTALHLVIRNSINYFVQHKENYINVVRALLSKGANVHLKNHSRETIVQQAFQVTHAGVLQTLIEHGADLSTSGNPVGLFLHNICNIPSIEDEIWAPMVDTLVQAGWNVNAVRPHDHVTPLMEACRFNCTAIAKKLIEKGANVNYVEKDNLMRPIHVAAMFSHTNQCINTETFFKMLAKVGANVNAKNRDGKTALHLVSHYHYHLVRRLLELGAHVDVRDKAGRLPLHETIIKGNIGTIKALLEFGAEINDAVVLRELNDLLSIIRTGEQIERIDYLPKHWLKLKAANLPIMDGFTNFVEKDSLREFHVKCLTEVEALKAYHLNPRTTLYDLLRMNVHSKYVFMANDEKLKELVESPLLETDFPKYHILILACYNKAVARKALIELAEKAWNDFTGRRLPDCLENIFGYLENEDLRAVAGEELEIKSLKLSSKTTLDKPAKRKRLE